MIVLSTNADELPVNEDNLVYKACRMLKQEYQITRGIRVFLQKELPVEPEWLAEVLMRQQR